MNLNMTLYLTNRRVKLGAGTVVRFRCPVKSDETPNVAYQGTANKHKEKVVPVTIRTDCDHETCDADSPTRPPASTSLVYSSCTSVGISNSVAGSMIWIWISLEACRIIRLRNGKDGRLRSFSAVVIAPHIASAVARTASKYISGMIYPAFNVKNGQSASNNTIRAPKGNPADATYLVIFNL